MPAAPELGTRTIFNILGPLTNPAAVRRQLTGAFSRAVIRPMAETLGELGSDRAWLVHGADGTDEVSIAGETFVAELNDGHVTEFSVHPEDAGLAAAPARRRSSAARPAENARALRAPPRRRALAPTATPCCSTPPPRSSSPSAPPTLARGRRARAPRASTPAPPAARPTGSPP